MSPAQIETLASFGRGFRLALTLHDAELAYLQVPATDDSAFARGHRRGQERRAEWGGRLAPAVARQLLCEETINVPAVA
jgi:hypothetical protein